MPFVDKDNKEVSPFSAIGSLPRETQKDYYHFLLAEMDQLDNALRRMRYEYDAPKESKPAAYLIPSILGYRETRSLARTLATSEYPADTAETHLLDQWRADTYYDCLGALSGKLDTQLKELRDLKKKRDRFNELSAAGDDAAAIKEAQKAYQNAETEYKKKYIPPKALRVEAMHLPELEVEEANIIALQKSCTQLRAHMAGVLTAHGINNAPDKKQPIADLKKQIEKNVAEMKFLGFEGINKRYNESVKHAINLAKMANTTQLQELAASVDHLKAQSENWYLARSGAKRRSDLEDILGRLYDESDQRRKGNSGKYTTMVTQAKALSTLLETKRGQEMGTAKKGELLKQIADAKKAAQEYSDAKADQFRPFPSQMRTRRLEETAKLITLLNEMEQEIKTAGPKIEEEVRVKRSRLREEHETNIAKIESDFRKPDVDRLQEKASEEIKDELYPPNIINDPDPDYIIDDDDILGGNLNINEEINKINTAHTLKKTGLENGTRQEINQRLSNINNQIRANQLKKAAEREGVTVIDYQKMLEKEKPDNDPLKLDEYRKVNTEKLVRDFRKTLSNAGIAESRYVRMTQKFTSKDPQEAREGLRELNAMGDAAASREPDPDKKPKVKARFIEKAIQTSTYMYELDVNDAEEMVMQASKMKLMPATVGQDGAEDAAIDNLRKALALQKQQVR